MNKELIISTPYTPSKGKTAKQHWLPSLRDAYFSPSSQRIECVASALTRWVDQTRSIATSTATSAVRWTAVIGADITGDDRKEHTGYIADQQTGKAIDPIIIRGRELPEIVADVHYYAHESRYHVHFSSASYKCELTPGQREQLKEWFEDGIIAATTPANVKALVANEIAWAVKTTETWLAAQAKIAAEILNLCSILKA